MNGNQEKISNSGKKAPLLNPQLINKPGEITMKKIMIWLVLCAMLGYSAFTWFAFLWKYGEGLPDYAKTLALEYAKKTGIVHRISQMGLEHGKSWLSEIKNEDIVDIFERFAREYILIVPDGNKVVFYRESSIDLPESPERDTFILKLNEKFKPFGPGTKATVWAIHKGSVELHIKSADYFGLASKYKSSREEIIDVPFSPSWKAAIFKGDADTLRALLKKGLDVNIQDDFRRTPLMVAASSGHREIVQLLLDNNADITLKQKDYHNALTLSLKHADVAGLLLDKGLDIGMDDLSIIASRGYVETMKVFIDHGADIRAQYCDEPTYLELAKGHPAMIELLKAHGVKE